MVDVIHCLTNLLFFDIPLLYYYTNFNSLITCFPFSGDMYLSFGISDSPVASLFCERSSTKCSFLREFLEIFVLSSAILLPIESPVASAVFLNCSF